MLNVSRVTVPVFILSLLLTTLVGMNQSANAALVSMYNVDSGWYDNTGLHMPTNLSYYVGRGSQATYNNWVLFDLTGIDVSKTIVDATLSVYNPSSQVDLGDGFYSADGTETYSLFDVNTPYTDLVAGGTGLTGIYDDLGSGLVLGTTSITAADNGFNVNLVFNSDGLAYLNAYRGQFVGIGGSITSLSADPNSQEYAFAWTYTSDSQQLTLTTQAVALPPTSGAVPEPTTAALGMMALVGMAASCRRRR